MLDIQNVRKTFNKNTINEKKALNGINLHLDEGDFVTVIGGNGAGKSTMLNMIAGYTLSTPARSRSTASTFPGNRSISAPATSAESSRIP